MDRVYDTSKYPPKPFVTLCQSQVIQSPEVKNRQISNFEFGWPNTCFWVRFLSRTQKTIIRMLFERPKSDKIENRRNAEIIVNSVKIILSKEQKTSPTPKRATKSRRLMSTVIGLVGARKPPRRWC